VDANSKIHRQILTREESSGEVRDSAPRGECRPASRDASRETGSEKTNALLVSVNVPLSITGHSSSSAALAGENKRGRVSIKRSGCSSRPGPPRMRGSSDRVIMSDVYMGRFWYNRITLLQKQAPSMRSSRQSRGTSPCEMPKLPQLMMCGCVLMSDAYTWGEAE
jgi:hypothetical protein